MSKRINEISRRHFLIGSAALGAGVITTPYLFRNAFAASIDRVTIYQNTVADSINPYNQSSGSIYGNWQHVIEPLVELDYTKKAWVGVLADSWKFEKRNQISQWRAADVERRRVLGRKDARPKRREPASIELQ
jgi:ABC-type transport system substrate-binding protein